MPLPSAERKSPLRPDPLFVLGRSKTVSQPKIRGSGSPQFAPANSAWGIRSTPSASLSTVPSTKNTGQSLKLWYSRLLTAVTSLAARSKSMTQAKFALRRFRRSSPLASSESTTYRERSSTRRITSHASTCLSKGLFLGAKRFGRAEQRSKICLILDSEKYRYQKFVSDIAGQDIESHGGEPQEAIKAVRNCLSNATARSIKIPGGTVIAKRYAVFREHLPAMCRKLHLHINELTFSDYVLQVEEWLKLNNQLGLTE